MPPRTSCRTDDNVYVGIDPGAGGGIAYLQGSKLVTLKMPDTTMSLWHKITEITALAKGNGAHMFALLEQVGGYTGSGEGEKGGGAANGSAMFKFGTNYGMCLMALTASWLPYETWTPGKWQKMVHMSSRRPKEKRHEWKRRLKEHAERLFPLPPGTITLATADAVLIAEACRRYRNGS